MGSVLGLGLVKGMVTQRLLYHRLMVPYEFLLPQAHLILSAY